MFKLCPLGQKWPRYRDHIDLGVTCIREYMKKSSCLKPQGIVGLYRLCLTVNFTLCKFHTVKNWYHFLTVREKLVPIIHVFHTNISHFVKNAHVVKLYAAFKRILHIDKIPLPKSAAFCIQFQFFTCMA